jgi:F0F1-type ATP synthase assembly protein I
MDNTVKPSKSYLQFGLILGLILILLFVVMYVINIDVSVNRLPGTISSVLSNLVFPVIFIILACNTYKKNNSGFISFGQCLKVGVSVVFIAALIFAVFNLIFNLIFPDYAEEILRQTRDIMLQKNPNMTAEQAEMGLSMARKFSSPVFSVPVILITFSFFGLIYSLIIGAFVKKDQPQSL